MDQEIINKLLNELDGSGSDQEFQAVNELKALDNMFPFYLAQKYKHSKSWKHRAASVYHAIKYARISDAAFTLGIDAVFDKSKVVRYRACMLLAYAQKNEAIQFLEKVYKQFKDSEEDALAAIDAIRCQNQHYFLDRNHSGKIKMNIPEV